MVLRDWATGVLQWLIQNVAIELKTKKIMSKRKVNPCSGCFLKFVNIN